MGISAVVSALAALSLITDSAHGQTVYGIESGVTSLSLDEDALDAIGFTITGTSDTVPANGGLDVGLEIDTDISPDDMFMFTWDGEFLAGPGIIPHKGTLELNSLIQIGNFVALYDDERFEEANSGFFLQDNADLEGLILFDVSDTDKNAFDGVNWTVDTTDLFIAPEFAEFLGDPSLTGQDIGDIRLDAVAFAKAVPEPSSSILVLLAGAFFLHRRRR